MELIDTQEQLRDHYGVLHPLAVRKVRAGLDDFCRRFIALSPFVVVASFDADGRADASPRGDAPGFVGRGVSALQIVCAPHYPATPRALVGGDVLQILTAVEREGKAGATVRRFFAAADAAAFANSAAAQDTLLAEKAGLKEILSKLEARL